MAPVYISFFSLLVVDCQLEILEFLVIYTDVIDWQRNARSLRNIYLGVYIDKHLNWQPQLQHINNKVAKNTGILTKLRHYLNLHMLKQIYYALIYPYLSYGIFAWGCTSNNRLNCLRIKLNKCLRCIFFAHARESAGPYYKLLGILKLDCIYKFRMSCLTHKIKTRTGSIPDVFSDILTPVNHVHSYNTRFANNLNFFRPRVSTNMGKSTYRFSSPKIWESIPLRIKSLPYNTFKNEYKCYLLYNQT